MDFAAMADNRYAVGGTQLVAELGDFRGIGMGDLEVIDVPAHRHLAPPNCFVCNARVIWVEDEAIVFEVTDEAPINRRVLRRRQ